MFAGLVENLGLKEGLAEFKEQFNKDAKAAIAESQFAKERGINVETLDAWETQLQQQGEAFTQTLHERTIGAAVDTLAQDETMAQLLDITTKGEEDDDEEGWEDDVDEEEGAHTTPSDTRVATHLVASGTTAEPEALASSATPDHPSNLSDAPKSPGSSSEVAGARGTVPTGTAMNGSGPHELEAPAASSSAIGSASAAASASGSTAVSAALPAVARPSSPPPSSAPAPSTSAASNAAHRAESRPTSAMATAAAAPSSGRPMPPRLKKLRAELSKAAQEKAKLEAMLESMKSESAAAEARWKEMSSLSSDATQQALEANFQLERLKRDLEDSELTLNRTRAERDALDAERLAARQKKSDLEMVFQERLDRELKEKEEHLHEETDYLKRAKEVKERRVKELTTEKEELEKQVKGQSRPGGGQSQSSAPALETHIALARAAGHLEAGTPQENPLFAALDGPSLKFTAQLLKQPFLRRTFFLGSFLAWFVVLWNVLSVGSGTHWVG